MNFADSLASYLKRMLPGNDLDRLYGEKQFLDAYSEHTNRRVALNPKTAIGGDWEGIGALQYAFLKTMGLVPGNSMLDIGCGTLRGGRHFIRFLDANKYSGIDISPKCVEAAKNLLSDENLESKNPQLVVNSSKIMGFAEFEGKTFDFILAHSVFTHLPAETIAQLVGNVGKVMTESSLFFFTFYEGKTAKKTGRKGFSYPRDFFRELAEENGFDIQDLSEEYPHPRRQKMACIARHKQLPLR